MKHKHYEVLVQWLADQTLELEYLTKEHPEWFVATKFNPISHPHLEWRIKPRTVRVGRHEWPMPLDVAPDRAADYWYVDHGTAVDCIWTDDESDRARLNAGMIHRTEEAAQQHADALVAINRGDV